jgi:hypothetical protein
MLSKITLALAFAFAVIYAVPAFDWPLLRLSHLGGDQCCYIGRWPAESRPSSLLWDRPVHDGR